MALQTDKIQARIEPTLKAAAESIFKRLGLSSTDAIRLFYKQVELHEGLPFSVEIPNKKISAPSRHPARSGTKIYKPIEAQFDHGKK